MKLKLSNILADFSDHNLFIKQSGADIEITGIAAVESFASGDIIFLGNKKFIKQLDQKKPTAAVVNEETSPFMEKMGVPCLVSSNVNLAQALLKQRYMDRDYSMEGWEQIHPSAMIHKTAKIGENVTIGPLVSIAANATIGTNSVILAGSVIEHNATIGTNCVIHPHAFIGYDCEIGNSTIIKQGAVIGSEGFGFAQDQNKKNHRIPQIGKVVIGDRVVIGALNTIERAAYNQTTVGNGSVFDTQCHLAHGVQVGEDCIIMSGTIVAGSTNIGNRVIASGQTGILDHLNICDDVVLLHRAGVTRDVKEPGLYAYLPLMKLQTYLKSSLQIGNLNEIKKKIADIEKKLDDKGTK